MAARYDAESFRPAAREGDWFTRQHALILVLIALSIGAFLLCFLMVRPFLPALSWSLALALVARPLHAWIAARVRHPGTAAALAVIAVALIIIVPIGLVAQQLALEAAASVERMRAESPNGDWRDVVQRLPQAAGFLAWLETIVDVDVQTQSVMAWLSAEATSLIQNSAWTAVQLLVALMTLFFLFRDQDEALGALRSLVPLSNTEADEVLSRIDDTIHATIYGTIVMAAVQGILGGLMFWWLGLTAPAFWGVVMGLMAVIPYLGAFIVWVPAAILLALEDQWTKALILTIWGSVVVGLIDNLLYPRLVGQRLRMHTLLVFFALFGGLVLFGASGIILGPVVLAITLALQDIWRRRTSAGRAAENGVHFERAVEVARADAPVPNCAPEIVSAATGERDGSPH